MRVASLERQLRRCEDAKKRQHRDRQPPVMSDSATGSSAWLWEQFRSAQQEEQRMRDCLLQAEAATLAVKEELVHTQVRCLVCSAG